MKEKPVKLAKTINSAWKKLKDSCKDHNPQHYPGLPHLTEEWCNNNNNRSTISALNLGHCSMSKCPLLK